MTAVAARGIPRRDASIDQAYDLMSARHIRHLVVTDRKSRPIGLLSQRAVAQAEIEAAASRLTKLPSFVGDEEGD